MHQAVLNNTTQFFFEKEIIEQTYMGLDLDLRNHIRDWLNKFAKPNFWWWDFFREEREISFYFVDPKMAMLFKLTWL